MKSPLMPAKVVVFSFACVACAVLLTAAPGVSAPKASANIVRIDRVEIAGPYATVHFDTEPFRSYTVQAALNAPTADSNWVNVFGAPALPFPDHQVYADPRTNGHRFYRLFVVP